MCLWEKIVLGFSSGKEKPEEKPWKLVALPGLIKKQVSFMREIRRAEREEKREEEKGVATCIIKLVNGTRTSAMIGINPGIRMDL